MAVNNVRQQIAYGLTNALQNVPYSPIISRRTPLSTDMAPIGQLWIVPSTNQAYLITSVVAGAANWDVLDTGSGTGTVLSVSGANGINVTGTSTINPVVNLDIPVTIAHGGTNATSFATTDGTVYFNGTSLVTTATGTLGQVLTSGGAGVAPAYAALPSSSISITGNSGGALTGNAFTFTGGTTGLTFSGSGTTETLTGTLAVSNGGSGAASFTTNGVLLGNNTSAFGVTAAGTTGQVLTGVTGSAPVWASPAGGSGALTLIQTQTASSVASLTFTTGITNTYRNYLVLIDNCIDASASSAIFQIQISTDGGGSYVASGYVNGGAALTSGLYAGNLLDGTTYVSGSIYLFNLTSGAGYITSSLNGMRMNSTGPTVTSSGVVGIYGTAAQIVNALKVFPNDGNTFSGQVSLYGYSN